MHELKKSMKELERISKEEFLETQKIPIVVILDNIRSMHNVGSVFRTSDSFLIERLYLCGFTPTPPHRDIQKTALGATETVQWFASPEIENCLLQLKNEDYTICAVEQVHHSILLQNFKIEKDKKYALIFGNEVEGVSEKALHLCDSFIEIPQLGTKHSLNISVTAGIVIWEFAKKYF
ncbi:MAG: RNA methyltransferase [Chitinophagaceae bacterium]|nr:MAG: tRNA/rRNA methyltransferase SpoU [Bacteroidetes bacterium OLB11]MCC6447557.1 RNA methyltransferase [Chitinophagaceae bacterium]